MKYFTKISIWLVFYISFIFLAGIKSYAQIAIHKQVFYESDFNGILDSLEKCEGKYKEFEANVKSPALTALQYYPELDTVPICFTRRKLGTTMAARPKWNFLFRKKSNREYLILLNKKPQFSDSIFYHLTFDAQVGMLGHEFAHIVYYTQLSNFGIIVFGFRYLFMKKEIERATDLSTIQHNLGWQLYDTRKNVLNSKKIEKEYHNNKVSHYLSPEEILENIEKIHANR